MQVWVGWHHPVFGRRGKRCYSRSFIPLCHPFCKPLGTDWKKLGIHPALGQPWGHRTEAEDTTRTLPGGAHHRAGEKSHAKCWRLKKTEGVKGGSRPGTWEGFLEEVGGLALRHRRKCRGEGGRRHAVLGTRPLHPSFPPGPPGSLRESRGSGSLREDKKEHLISQFCGPRGPGTASAQRW